MDPMMTQAPAQRFRTRVALATSALAALSLAACGDDNDNSPPTDSPEPTASIAEIAAGDARLQTLVAALDAAGLVGTFSAEGSYTVFAPTDDAFAALPEGALDGLLADTDALADVLRYHVAPQALDSQAVIAAGTVTTLDGGELTVEIDGDAVLVAGATVAEADILASNGVIHVIDAVLLPPVDVEPPVSNTIVDVAANAGTFTTLLAAAETAGLVETLTGDGPLTVFAPTDDAFAAFLDSAGLTAEELLARPDLADILLYHVVLGARDAASVAGSSLIASANGIDLKVEVDGDTVTVGGAPISAVDIAADNGIVHIIDAVMMPPGTITDIVVASDDFTLLEAAVVAADLADALAGEGPLTVFAPTDDAITALVSELGITPEELLAMDDLADILLFHATAGKFTAEDVLGMSSVDTLLGVPAAVEVDMGTATIAGAAIIATDIPAANGVIHVIDAVMLPPTDVEPPVSNTIVDVATNAGTFTTLLAAVEAAGLVETLTGDGPFTVFAPTDDAFAAFLDSAGLTAEELLASPDLADILLYHVVLGARDAVSVAGSSLIESANGIDLKVEVDGDDVTIGGAPISAIDIAADNGIVHIIDAVMMPPGTITDIVVASDDFTLLEAAVVAAELAETLAGEGPFTVFAPTDAAVEALIEELGITAEELLALDTLPDILLFHVASGKLAAADVLGMSSVETLAGAEAAIGMGDDGPEIAGAAIIATDIPAANGIIHVIDAVILPPSE